MAMNSSLPVKHVTGRATYVDDIYLPGMVYAGFVRSPYAHARIKRVDFENVDKSSLVRAVAGPEIAKIIKPIPTYLYSEGKKRVPQWDSLAVDTVNFAGEAVAAVVAGSRANVEDLIDQVEVEYEPIQPMMDAESAIQPNAQLVHEELGSNVAITMRVAGGDFSEALRRSDFTIKRRFTMHRHAAVPMEPRGAVANYEPSTGFLTLWASTQIPFIMKSHLSQLTGIPENRIRVIAPDIGGGFGAKLQLSPEYLVVCALSMLTKRPVKWVETRSENLAASVHAREQTHDVEAAFTSDGRLLGIKDRALMDAGAYLDTRISGQAVCSFYVLEGPYKVEAIDAEVSIVLTNKCPYGAYRGFGSETGAMIVERLLNVAARKIGIDQVEIRRRNLIRRSEMPYKTALGFIYEPADYEETLNKALELVDYPGMLKNLADMRKAGRIVGMGLSMAVEPSSTNAYIGVVDPSEVAQSVDFGGASIRMDPKGTVRVGLGTVSLGAGHPEVVSKVVAERLGIAPEDIQVVEGDTELTPYDCGVRASRFSAVVLPAVLGATEMLKAKLVMAAAFQLGAEKNNVIVQNRRFYVKGSPNAYLKLENVANTFYANADKLPEGLEPALQVTYFFKPEKIGMFNTFSHTVHIPVIEYDKETGAHKFLKYVVVGDCGNVMVREVVDGQIAGGLLQMIGGVFFEEMKYDENGQLLTSTFMDYLLPTSLEAIDVSIDHTVSPSRLPGGAKGMAESSIVCGFAAIMNATDDALAPMGAEINHAYLPPESIWKLIRKGPTTPQSREQLQLVQ